MDESLRDAKEKLQEQMQQQKEQFERQLQDFLQPLPEEPKDEFGFTVKQLAIAKQAFLQWRQRKYVSMAEAILQNASALKEAQVMSQQMDKSVVFQFTVVDSGYTFGSSYDLVLNGISAEDDEELEGCPKPCVA
ncbi:hypothetical protein LTR16_011078, partial [Cryomyces antarcticus]